MLAVVRRWYHARQALRTNNGLATARPVPTLPAIGMHHSDPERTVNMREAERFVSLKHASRRARGPRA